MAQAVSYAGYADNPGYAVDPPYAVRRTETPGDPKPIARSRSLMASHGLLSSRAHNSRSTAGFIAGTSRVAASQTISVSMAK